MFEDKGPKDMDHGWAGPGNVKAVRVVFLARPDLGKGLAVQIVCPNVEGFCVLVDAAECNSRGGICFFKMLGNNAW